MLPTERPNLFIVGAMKSGTSSLHSLLGRHPDIFMSDPKEPMFFSQHAEWESHLAHYQQLFLRRTSERWFGESSTEYAKAPHYGDVAKRLWDFNPQSRLIYLMRDPVERSISHYWHLVRNQGDTRPIRRVIEDVPELIDVSNYGYQIRQWLRYFPANQLWTGTFESFTGDPAATCRTIFRWLGAESDINLGDPGLRSNQTPENFDQSRSRMLQGLRHSAFWNAVGPYCPNFVRRMASGVAVRSVRRGSEEVEGELSAARDKLRTRLIHCTEDLGALLGRSFPEWKTLIGTDDATCSRPV